MAEDHRKEEILREERNRIQAEERFKNFLNNRSIGGQNVPRPTPEYIEQSLGKQRSGAQQSKDATHAADRRVKQEQLAEQRKKEIAASIERHNRDVAARTENRSNERSGQDQQKSRQTGLRDHLKREQEQKRGRGR